MEIEVDGMQEIVLDMVTVLEVTVLAVTDPAVLEVVVTVPVMTDPVVTVLEVTDLIVALPPLIAVATVLLHLALRSSIIHPEGAALTSIAH